MFPLSLRKLIEITKQEICFPLEIEQEEKSIGNKGKEERLLVIEQNCRKFRKEENQHKLERYCENLLINEKRGNKKVK